LNHKIKNLKDYLKDKESRKSRKFLAAVGIISTIVSYFTLGRLELLSGEQIIVAIVVPGLLWILSIVLTRDWKSLSVVVVLIGAFVGILLAQLIR